MTVLSPEQWENDFKPILTATREDEIRLAEARTRWADPVDGKPGEFKLERVEQPEDAGINFGSGIAPE